MCVCINDQENDFLTSPTALSSWEAMFCSRVYQLWLAETRRSRTMADQTRIRQNDLDDDLVDILWSDKTIPYQQLTKQQSCILHQFSDLNYSQISKHLEINRTQMPRREQRHELAASTRTRSAAGADWISQRSPRLVQVKQQAAVVLEIQTLR